MDALRSRRIEGGEFAVQGLGNDYIIVETAALPAPLTAEGVRLLCDRHLGVGSDGILLHETPSGAVPGAAARMRVYNPDGSEAEMCGNGIRMFAKYLRRTGAVAEDAFLIETLAGPIAPRLMPDGRVRVHMGTARFRSENIAGGFAGSGEDVVAQELPVDGERHLFTFVDVGNPHCVIPVDDLSGLPLDRLGPVIEHLPLFPNRVNVEFIRREADGSISVRVWERGVGETQACGTGAAAVGAAAVRLGLAGSPVRVHLPGGDLDIDVAAGWQVVMTGPAEETFTGSLSAELLARLGWKEA
ncbi:MAG: diaminopimelate epimerase [Actinobacteria bacterium]|nr:diaminopimelate epimerase [Actinomycetota bacterium]